MTEQFERRRALFSPARTDDLCVGAEDWIGVEATWQAVWVIESGPYEGQWAWAFWSLFDGPRPPFAWTPECDLTFTGEADA